MNRLLLSFLLSTSFFVFTSYAQDDVYKIRLSGVNATILLKGYFVERVINAQDDDTIIGFVQTGMFNKKRLASLSTSITEDIGKYLKIVLPLNGEAVPLIVRINKLNIFEVTSGSHETAFAELNLSFIRRNGSRYYHLFDAGTCFQQGGIDVTHTHAENIVHAMEICFADLRAALLTNRVDNIEISEKELSFNPLKDPTSYPVFHTSKIPRGVFRTFYDFRDCNADTQIPFEVRVKSKKDTAKSKVSISYSDSYGPDAFWGFSDGNSIYMRIMKFYYKLYPEQNAFVSHVAYNEIGDMSSAYAMAGILGGLVGVAILATVVSATYHGITDPSKDGYFRVDFCHGSLTPSSHSEFNELDSKTVFAICGTIDPSKSICLFVNNEFNVVIRGGTYYTLNLPPRMKNATIGLRMDSLHYTQSISLNPFENSLYYVHLSNRKGILMDYISGDKETSLLNGMSEWNTIHQNGKGSNECNH
jgi:hypothetical protein